MQKFAFSSVFEILARRAAPAAGNFEMLARRAAPASLNFAKFRTLFISEKPASLSDD